MQDINKARADLEASYLLVSFYGTVRFVMPRSHDSPETTTESRVYAKAKSLYFRLKLGLSDFTNTTWVRTERTDLGEGRTFIVMGQGKGSHQLGSYKIG